MFKWLYEKAFNGILTEAQDWIESKEGTEYLHEVADSIVDRELARISSSAGGVMHNPASGLNSQTLIGSLMQAVLPKLLNTSSNSNMSNGENPFGSLQKK